MLKEMYLSSLESEFWGVVRHCGNLSILHFASGKPALRGVIDPTALGQTFGLSVDVAEVLFTARHVGFPVDKITKFPCFVHIAIPRKSLVDRQFTSNDLIHAGIGELYRSRADAENHRFDP